MADQIDLQLQKQTLKIMRTNFALLAIVAVALSVVLALLIAKFIYT
jgi:hypothetical protein